MNVSSSSNSVEAHGEPTPVPPGRELQAGQRVHGHRIGIDAADVTEGDLGVAPLEQRADPSAEAREVGPRDRTGDGERDRPRCWDVHRDIDRRQAENSSLGRPMSSPGRAGRNV